MLLKKHWIPEYVWHRVTQIVYQWSSRNSPWLTESAVQILDRWLRPTDRAMGWGSGRSTVWLAERVGHLLALEHNPEWLGLVAEKLRSHRLLIVDLRLALDTSPTIKDESLDFAIVDGVERDACALNAIRHLKLGGISWVDDAHRYLPSQCRSPFARRMDSEPATAEWARFAEELRGWRCGWTPKPC